MSSKQHYVRRKRIIIENNMNEKLKLCFVKFIGVDLNGLYQYEFLFSDKIDEVWGENFEIMPAGLCHDLTPNQEDYCAVKNISMDVKLQLVQNSCCFSLQDCMDGIISLAYGYKDDKIVINLKYGETLENVENKLIKLNTYLI